MPKNLKGFLLTLAMLTLVSLNAFADGDMPGGSRSGDPTPSPQNTPLQNASTQNEPEPMFADIYDSVIDYLSNLLS